jgi:hypothetical protein
LARRHGPVYELLRIRTRDGPETTVYLVRHPLAATRVSVVRFAEPARLDVWCAARLMISFGAREAINLDGGGSATLVHRRHLLNRPYSSEDQPAPESRPIVTALLFDG